MGIRLLPVLLGAAVLLTAAADTPKTSTVKGYVIDSACTFTKNLKKPISSECAQACAKAGSPLVILSDNGSMYWPTTDAMPATSQNEKLLPFAGKRVVATGKVYERGGSKALLIEKIEAEK
jgi:hypothetical protein